MVFFTDVVLHFQSLNLSLQDQGKLISDLTQTMFSFQNKVILFKKDIAAKRFAHFTSLKKILESLHEIEVKTVDYICKLNGLTEEKNERFSDIRALKPMSAFFGKSLSCGHHEEFFPTSKPIMMVSVVVELELLEIQEHEGFKH